MTLKNLCDECVKRSHCFWYDPFDFTYECSRLRRKTDETE